VLVLAPATQAMVLLGEVDELEVRAERAQHERLLLDVERGDRVPERPSVLVSPRLARGACEEADPLLRLEQLLALLLDQDASERVAEQAHVATQRGIGASARRELVARVRRARVLHALRGYFGCSTIRM
jgi:hypothetical protein